MSVFFPRSVDLSQPGAIAPFTDRQLVVLSPHYDDACFALGGFLQHIGKGILINIFTQGNHVARKNRRVPRPNPQEVGRIRRAEDVAFAEYCGMNRYEIGAEEPSLRGRRIRQMHFIDEDVAQIEAPLKTVLSDLAASRKMPERGLLFAPLGLSWHCNHRAVYRFVQRNMVALQQDFEILFYEDMPYSSHAWSRWMGLARLQAEMHKAVRYYWPLAWDEKLCLLQYYPSQFKKPAERRRFHPAILKPLHLHEAFWRCP